MFVRPRVLRVDEYLSSLRIARLRSSHFAWSSFSSHGLSSIADERRQVSKARRTCRRASGAGKRSASRRSIGKSISTQISKTGAKNGQNNTISYS